MQPGKHYRYRVRIVIRNPSYGVPGSYLAEDSVGKKKVLENKDAWSEPTEPVAVPLDSQVLAAAAKESASTGPLATAMIIKFNEADGAVAADEFPNLPRGKMLNYAKWRLKTAPVASSQGMGGMSGMAGMAGMETMMTAGKRKKGGEETEAKPAEVDFETNCLLLDITGGGKLAGKERKSLTEPANFLLLDKDGMLIVHNELDDLPERQRHTPPAVPTNTGSNSGSSRPSGPQSSSMYDMPVGKKGVKKKSK